MPPLHDSMSCSEHMKTNSAEDRTRQESLQQNICSFHVQLTSLRNQQKARPFPRWKTEKVRRYWRSLNQYKRFFIGIQHFDISNIDIP